MKTRAEAAAVFSCGATLYAAIEVMWRGSTHWTMALAGGCCFSMLYAVEKYTRWSFLGKCAYGAAFITGVEFQIGCVVNRSLGWNIWDYSAIAGNFMGQVCPAFTAMWFALCIPALLLAACLRRALA